MNATSLSVLIVLLALPATRITDALHGVVWFAHCYHAVLPSACWWRVACTGARVLRDEGIWVGTKPSEIQMIAWAALQLARHGHVHRRALFKTAHGRLL